LCPDKSLRNPQGALEAAYQSVMVSNRTNPHFLDLLAMAYEVTGEKEKAMSISEEVVKMKPDMETARKRIEQLKAGNGQKTSS
jgi:hypothetical protein